MPHRGVRRVVLTGLVGLGLATGSAPCLAGLMVTSPQSFGNVLVGGPAATGTVTAKNLGPGAATIRFGVPSSLTPFTLGGATEQPGVALNASTSRTYSYAPVTAGSATTTVNVSSSNGGSVGVVLTGRGVAPVNATTSNGAGLTRIGTQGEAAVTVRNTGDGNTTSAGAAVGNLVGAVKGLNGSGNFAGPTSAGIHLGDGATQRLSYAYAPTDHAEDSATVTLQFDNGSADRRNQSETVAATITGRGVGPEFRASAAPESTIDLGLVDPGLGAHLAFEILNATTDPDGGLGSLTGLTLLSAMITGPDAGDFSLLGFADGTVLDRGSNLIFDLVFRPSGAAGRHSASLTFLTDQGTAFGGIGRSFRFDLVGALSDPPSVTLSAVPEPSTLSMSTVAALAGLGLAWRRRRVATGRRCQAEGTPR